MLLKPTCCSFDQHHLHLKISRSSLSLIITRLQLSACPISALEDVPNQPSLTASLAQLVEHALRKCMVTGSIPVEG